MDGGYSGWQAWGACTVTCGGGTMMRTRSCTEPQPSGGGKDCHELGASFESKGCNTQGCPPPGRKITISDHRSGKLLLLLL